MDLLARRSNSGPGAISAPLAGSSHCATRASQAGGPSFAEAEWKLPNRLQKTTTDSLAILLNAEIGDEFLIRMRYTGNG